MGLLQKACETYDAMAGRVGIMYEKEKEPLAPISHMMARPQIKITSPPLMRLPAVSAAPKPSGVQPLCVTAVRMGQFTLFASKTARHLKLCAG